MKRSLLVIISICLGGLELAYADISDTFRKQNAVVLYEFNETTGQVLDTADPKFGPPVNLDIYYPASTKRTPGVLEISDPNVIRSTLPADKIVTECKKTGSMTMEVWLENNETVERRSGLDAARRRQPLRILSFSKGLFDRNFVLGQFYDMGNMYAAGIVTAPIETADVRTLGNSLTDPLLSRVAATILPDPSSPRVVSSLLQKVVVTLGPSGLAKLYLSDRNGFMYLAPPEDAGSFGNGTAASYFANWKTGSYLTLGNESMSPAEFTSALNLNRFFQGCSATRNASDQCFTNPNRYWKGKLHKVAVYCQEVAREDILGSGTGNVMKNALLDIDINTQITPSRKKAQEIHARLTGIKTPITNPVLGEMETLLDAGDPVSAAAKATADSSFINVTVRDFATKMSNRDETINVPLNDFTATVIGFVRDEINAKKMLTDNVVYQADPAQAPVPGDVIDDLLRSNNHYESLSQGRYDLNKVLIQKTQKVFNGTIAVDNPTPAGLLTTRQWMAAHAIAGTNRRLIEFSFRQFTCNAMEKIADSTGPDNVIGVDIDRFPGGSHSKFTSSCRACHTIMDGFRPAFARWTFSNSFAKHSFVVPSIAANVDEATSVGMIMDPPFVTRKLNQNATVFPEGRRTVDDSWVNNAVRGTNADLFKWTMTSGRGVRDFGQAISETAAFPHCMAERVFRQICKRAPASSDQGMLNQVAKEFSTVRSFNLKYLFQKIVTTDECLGGAHE